MLLKTPLVDIIRERIRQSPRQAISFRDYMELCLYHPQYGYYSQPKPKIGRNGDFYTSSSIGRVMGEMLAAFVLQQTQERAREAWTIAEWGGGSGRLAAQILGEIRRQAPDCYDRLTYEMIERSEFHRALQRQALQEHGSKVRFLDGDEWLAGVHGGGGAARGGESFAQEDEPFTVVLSNELLDAFPVHLVQYEPDGWQEILVAWHDDEQRFVEKPVPLVHPEVERFIGQYVESVPGGTRPGQRVEVNLEAGEWLRKVAKRVKDGMIVTVDYGDVSEELYAPHRMRGTLMCYRKHEAHDDPYAWPGEQDMTSHVNFSACIRAGEEAGVQVSTMKTQKQFLVEAGILGKLRDHCAADPFSAEARSNRAIRQLLLSDGMSELFKVLIQRKTPVVGQKER